MFFFNSSSGTGTVTFVLPAGSMIVCEKAGLVKANYRPAREANGLRLDNGSMSIGMELTETVSTFCHVRLIPAARTATSIAGTLAADWRCACPLSSASATELSLDCIRSDGQR
jgi:hypothetical protein